MVKANASLAAGHYTLALTASKNGQTKSTTLSVQVASNGPNVTVSTPPAEGGKSTMPTATGAFAGKTFSMHLVVNGDTLLLTSTAPTASALTSLSGQFVTSKPGATAVSGTFTLTQSAPPPQAHTKQLKNYGDDTSSGDGQGGVIDAIGRWIDGLFNW